MKAKLSSDFYTRVDELYQSGMRGWAEIGQQALRETGSVFTGRAKNLSDAVRCRIQNRIARGTLGEVIAEPKPKPEPQPKKEPEEVDPLVQLGLDRETRKWRAKYETEKKKYNAAVQELERSELRVDAALQIAEEVPYLAVPVDLSSKAQQASAILQLSDWHCEEKVDASTISGINEYNPDIAKRRAVMCFQRALKVIRGQRSNFDIDTLVLWLGGDFITGYIHEELEESNYLSPTEATLLAKELLISGIDFMVQHGGFKKIKIVCNFGNHGRTGKRPRISTGYKNSYEWMLYETLNTHFRVRGYDCIEFSNTKGIYNYITLYDRYTIRTFHGDHIKYGGGIGGITIPLRKAIYDMNAVDPAYYNLMGHFHQFWEASNDCLVNGSLIGYNSYAQFIRAKPEPPMQGLRIIDSKYGLTIKTPIICG